MDLTDALVNIAGFAMVIIVTYMVVRNVIRPRFYFPWVRGREKERLLERGRRLLDDTELDADERERVNSAMNTLAIRGRHTGESWTREDPFNSARADINEVWSRHNASNSDHHSMPKTGES